jgi:hypothetical protein
MKALLNEAGLYSISGFWRNDTPLGLAITITEDSVPVPLESIWNDVMVKWEQMWEVEEDKDVLVNDLFSQLEAIAADSSETLSAEHAMMALANIWLLERYGYIGTDEHNGMVYATFEGMCMAVPRHN